MRVAIFANNENSFVKPMAEGLARMLSAIGEEPTLFYDGHDFLRENGPSSSMYRAFVRGFSTVKVVVGRAIGREYKLSAIEKFARTDKQLEEFDLIILVGHVPTCFFKAWFAGIEQLRNRANVPIVLYDLTNLATLGPWINRIKNDYPGGGFGFERYDWYLSASVMSEFPMPEEYDAYSVIGMDLRDGSLRPEKSREFIAVLDFAREGFEQEREIQKEALQATNTSYVMLDGPMSIEEIRSIYRKAHFFFLSFRESFGLPIVELQLCGSYICVPHRRWAPSHYVDKSIHDRGEGNLSRNFLIYDNDKERLVTMINQVRSSYRAEAVVEELRIRQPHLFQGDLTELERFVAKVESGDISSKSHEKYDRFNKLVITEL
jgi:hypothetical protein